MIVASHVCYYPISSRWRAGYRPSFPTGAMRNIIRILPLLVLKREETD
jgi:hypothetical protein